VIGAEGIAAPVAVELIAARAQERSAGGVRTRFHRDHGVSAVFIIFNGNTVEIGVAVGAGGGSKFRSHVYIMN
jgi:hypothetical protein